MLKWTVILIGISMVEGERLNCTMSKCFDASKCRDSKKIFIHPIMKQFENSPMSTAYHRILDFYRNSNYLTENASEACIFLLGIDTTDRDVRSRGYVKNVDEYLSMIDEKVWNSGRNHIIFNFYHGTFPDYDDHHLNFDTGHAIIARASSNQKNFLKDFDISLPLFHEDYPMKREKKKLRKNHKLPYLISFKGKRYVYGIGSTTRNLVHHLHNGNDIIMVTTCKHNNDWQTYQDDRCQFDNEQYEKWDYDELLTNSTYCLVPRGRRLGSFRFLETLSAGCVPVVISDSWLLPLFETIDWTKSAIIVAEKDALWLPELLMSMSRQKVSELQENGEKVYWKYLSSVEKISEAVIEIIFKRIDGMIFEGM